MDDKDVVESWEDADTEELEKRMELRQRHSESKVVCSDESCLRAGHSAALAVNPAPLRTSEWEGTQYVAPVKILKRPTETEGEGLSRAAEQASSEYKTLAQREAEYASARARILGSSSNESSSTRETGRADK